MYQFCVVVGNCGRDPEMRYTQGGTAVCDFSVAVSRKWTDKQSGEQREKTTWFRVSAWNQLAELCNQYVKKGQRILVTGEVDASAWVGQDGAAKATLELTARDVKFLSRKDEDASADSAPADESRDDLHSIPF